MYLENRWTEYALTATDTEVMVKVVRVNTVAEKLRVQKRQKTHIHQTCSSFQRSILHLAISCRQEAHSNGD